MALSREEMNARLDGAVQSFQQVATAISQLATDQKAAFDRLVAAASQGGDFSAEAARLDGLIAAGKAMADQTAAMDRDALVQGQVPEPPVPPTPPAVEPPVP